MPLGLQRYFYLAIRLLIPATIALYALSCATIVSPTGGPKDVTPPKMISSQPTDQSTNFKGDRLILNFDEYVTLKTPEKFLLISPPLKEMPDIKVKGHSVVIKLEDSLRSNTTYNFYLGDAIVDLTEANPVSNFNFAFSTGPEIDSLSLAGNVTDAFTRMPVKGALVMLYSDFSDSVPMKQIPMYVSRTTENGDFSLNSLASGKYRAIALLDGNSDYMYDLPTELIGFSSDSVQPYYNAVKRRDTSAVKLKDTITVKLQDTVAIKQNDIAKQLLISIDLFPQPDSIQRIQKSSMIAKNKLFIAFRYPTKSPQFRALNVPDSFPWAYMEWNHSNDTLSAWLVNKPDTLKLEVTDYGVIIDTITLSTTQKTSGKTKNSETVTRLKYSTPINGKMLGFNKPFIVAFTNPVKEYNLNALELNIISNRDTSIIKPVALFTDSIHRHLIINYAWKATDMYDLYFPKNSFIDIYSDSCDSTHVAFRMRPEEDYGKFSIIVNRVDKSYPVIIQLLNEKGIAVDERIITTEKRVDFRLLSPAKYGVKAIMDINSNGRWDTGVLTKKIQPERVLIHPKLFEVRTNWELEETWDL